MPTRSLLMGSGTPAAQATQITGTARNQVLATGTTRTDATQITDSWISITNGSPSGAGLVMPPIEMGTFGGIYNNSSFAVNLYPFETTTQFNSGALGSPISLASMKALIYFVPGITRWVTVVGA